MIKYLENDSLDDVIGNELTIVDFYADWCGPCKMLGVELEKLVKDIDISIIKVNADNYTLLAQKYAVMSIPAIFFFKDKKIVKNHVGFIDKNNIIKIINELK